MILNESLLCFVKIAGYDNRQKNVIAICVALGLLVYRKWLESVSLLKDG